MGSSEVSSVDVVSSLSDSSGEVLSVVFPSVALAIVITQSEAYFSTAAVSVISLFLFSSTNSVTDTQQNLSLRVMLILD